MSVEPESEREAREFFEAMGLGVSKVPTSHKETADFAIDGDGPGYLVEVKARNPPDGMRTAFGSVVEPQDRSMREDPKTLEYLGKASAQMRTLDPDHSKLWFLWLAVESSFDADAQAERAISALYGVRGAFELELPNREFICWYAGRACFDRYPAIDAVMVYRPYKPDAAGPAFSFNVNEASPRLDAVMRSKVVRELTGIGAGPRLPSLSKGESELVVPRGLLEREGQVAVLRYVQQLTGSFTLNFYAIESQSISVLRLNAAAVRGGDV